MAEPKLAFIGSGRMASAMVKGLLASAVTSAASIRCTGAPDGSAEALAAATGINCTYDAQTLLEGADWVILACKPQQLAEIPDSTARLCADRMVLSILAGTRLGRLRERFPLARGLVRAMPNTPGQIGMGITAFCSDRPLELAVKALVSRILGALGDVIELQEEQLDAVTALSGSGPAYVFEMVAGLRDAGIAVGLPAEVAYTLALKTVHGAAALLAAVPATPEQHRDWVSSPGGTTLAGLAVMGKAGFRNILRETVEAAYRRSIELGNAAAGQSRS